MMGSAVADGQYLRATAEEMRDNIKSFSQMKPQAAQQAQGHLGGQ